MASSAIPFSTTVRSQAPAAEGITPALVEAARKEGKIVWYTSVDLPVAEKVAKAFEAKFSGVSVRVERTGAERQRRRQNCCLQQARSSHGGLSAA